jgi:hypothetical protein
LEGFLLRVPAGGMIFDPLRAHKKAFLIGGLFCFNFTK